jgi:U3 small nucleolar RNA-associated protein 20
MEIGGLDYDIVIGAYEKINKDLFYTLQKEHVLVLLSHAVHDMSSEEMILRQSAYGLLVCFVEFAGEIMDGKEVAGPGCWSEAGVKQIMSNFILMHMGNAMSKETSVQKV